MLFGRAAVGEDVGLYDFELSMSDKRFGCCTEAVDHALETDVFAVITTKCEPFTSSSDKNTKDTPKKQVLAARSCPGDARLPSQRPGAWQTPRIIGELIAQDKLGHLHGGIIENVPDMIDDDPESPWGSDPARSIARGRARGDRATFTPDAARRSRRSRRSSTCSSSRPRSWRTSASPTGASARWSSSGARTEDRGPSATSENPPNLVTRGHRGLPTRDAPWRKR